LIENIDVTGIVAILTVMAAGVTIAIVAIITWYGNRKMEHQARLKAIEKGATIPVFAEKVQTPYRTLKAALVWTAVGLGIYVSLVHYADEPEAAFLGIIPFFVGIALFISWLVERKGFQEKEKQTTPA
jgi:sulfite reductase beta subunit-like hemoprotein